VPEELARQKHLRWWEEETGAAEEAEAASEAGAGGEASSGDGV